MHLDGPMCSESFPERTYYFEPPEHVPWTSGRAQTCAWGPDGLPACHGAESEKRPGAGREKMPKGQNNTYVVI